MSDLVKIRKYVATVEETLHDFGPALARPVTKAVVASLILILVLDYFVTKALM